MPVDRYTADLKLVETVIFKVAFLRAVLSSLYWVYDDMMFSRSLQDYVSSLLRLSLRIKLI